MFHDPELLRLEKRRQREAADAELQRQLRQNTVGRRRREAFGKLAAWVAVLAVVVVALLGTVNLFPAVDEQTADQWSPTAYHQVVASTNGGTIGQRNIPTSALASGVWDMEDAANAQLAGAWPKIVYAIDYLVVGGGGSGSPGNDGSTYGGGGAGGNVVPGTTTSESAFTITVGAGGPAKSGNNTAGNAGTASSIAGIATADGGAGGLANGTGGANTGHTGGTNSGVNGSGGGAGSSANGVNGSGAGGGAGGAGTASSITGSSVVYGPGGGGAPSGAAGGTGATAGGTYTVNSAAATANTGAGTGGTLAATTGAAAAGVVFLRMPTVNYSGVTTGSPTVTTDGAFTVLKFTSSGSYTP